jgi:hypothetical protein
MPTHIHIAPAPLCQEHKKVIPMREPNSVCVSTSEVSICVKLIGGSVHQASLRGTIHVQAASVYIYILQYMSLISSNSPIQAEEHGKFCKQIIESM